MATRLPRDLEVAVRLGGEMGRRFAEFDWDSHPLGSPQQWPVQLRAMVAVALTSRFPIVLWLGSQDLFLVYNDAYIPMLADKHPAALGVQGRRVWWEIWDEIGPMLSGVLTSGAATWSNDLMLALVNGGAAQERYFTFSYSPIISGDGQIDAVFCAVTETTERVLGERRLHVLNAVAGAAMEARTADEAVTAMVRACGDTHPDLPFIAVYLDEGGDRMGLRAAGRRVTGVIPLDLSVPEEAADSDGERAAAYLVELDDIAPRLGLAFDGIRPRQALVMPIGEPGPDQIAGRLMVGLNPRRRVDEQYRAFLRLLADQLSSALAAADSHRRQRQRADALAELDLAKTTFLTNVSHEFRTPLTLLLGPLEDAIARAEGDPAQLDRLTMARRNGQRLLRLVNSLLEFSRVEAGRATLASEPVDLGALTAQVASSFAGLCERAGIELVVRCAPVTADVDVHMWETIVLNLLSNAVKFTFAGSITVQAGPAPSGGSLLRVVDTGTGIDPDDLPRLFDRFYRARNSRGRSAEGSGIGLSLVRSLVELHGGTVGMESRPGRGTTVTVELPASRHEQHEQHEQPRAAVPPPRTRESTDSTADSTAGSADSTADSADSTADFADGADLANGAADLADNAYVAEAMQWLDQPATAAGPAGPRTTDRPLVLIADDNADMRAHLTRILSQRWDTIEAADGRAALEAMRRHHPDLLVTDVMMPVLDGFGLAQAIREDPQLAATPVLMLSARAGVEAAGDGFAAGADDYLTKPFTSAELLHRAEARLNVNARHRARQAEQEARGRQEAATADLSTAIATAGSIDAVLAALLTGPHSATAAAIGLRANGDRHLTVHYIGDIKPELRARYHRVAIDAPVPIADVVATGEPMIISGNAPLDSRFEQVVRDAAPDIQAAAVYPLRDPSGAIIGALALLWPRPTAFDDAARALFAHVATVTGHALTRITMAAREHRIATGFQEHLLDLDRRSTDAVVAAVYQPAAEAMRVGGDWYLATPLGAGQIGVCVGDVVGHGLPAATVMSKLRAAVSATALTTPDPARVLAAVQRYAATVPGARCSTLAYATIDTARGTIDYISAGHPYPLLVTADGQCQFLRDGRTPPLDAFAAGAHERQAGRALLPPGSLLIFYTDGLIERRGQFLQDGFDRLAAAAAGCAHLPVDVVCSTLLQQLAPGHGYTDDVAILALRPAAVTDTSFVTALPAAAGELAPLRRRLGQWLSGLDDDPETCQKVLIAVGEAAVNAIEHGSGLDPDKSISLEAFAIDETISVSVSDAGQWHGDSAASRRSRQRGRGLTLMYGMADRVDTIRGPRGTTVTLHFPRSAARVEAAVGARP